MDVKYSHIFLGVLLFGSAAYASPRPCLELQDPIIFGPQTEKSPRNELIALGLQEVGIAWKTCEAESRYTLALRSGSGKVHNHVLTPSQKRSFTTNLLLRPGESYTLSIERFDELGKSVERVEKKFQLEGATPEQLSRLRQDRGRELASVGGFLVQHEAEHDRWIEPYLGLGFVSYNSSLSYESAGFSLPAVVGGFHTLSKQALGLEFDLLQSVGSAAVSAINSVTSFLSFSTNANYKIPLREDFTLAPLLFFSYQSSTLENASNNQVNSLRHVGAGLKSFWRDGNFGLMSSLSYAPSFGNSQTKLNLFEAQLRPGYVFTRSISVQVPVVYRSFSGQSAYGGTNINSLSAGGTASYAF